MAQVFRFLPGRFRLLAVAEPDKDSVQGAWMTVVRFFLPQLAVQFANAAVGISAMVVPALCEHWGVGCEDDVTCWQGTLSYHRTAYSSA